MVTNSKIILLPTASFAVQNMVFIQKINTLKSKNQLLIHGTMLILSKKHVNERGKPKHLLFDSVQSKFRKS